MAEVISTAWGSTPASPRATELVRFLVAVGQGAATSARSLQWSPARRLSDRYPLQPIDESQRLITSGRSFQLLLQIEGLMHSKLLAALKAALEENIGTETKISTLFGWDIARRRSIDKCQMEHIVYKMWNTRCCE